VRPNPYGGATPAQILPIPLRRSSDHIFDCGPDEIARQVAAKRDVETPAGAADALRVNQTCDVTVGPPHRRTGGRGVAEAPTPRWSHAAAPSSCAAAPARGDAFLHMVPVESFEVEGVRK
jgi:hypothetical protein